MDSCSAQLLEMIVAVRGANKQDKNNNRGEEEKAASFESSSSSDSSEWDDDDGEVERRNLKRRPAGRPRFPRRAKRERKDEPRDDLQNCSGLRLQIQYPAQTLKDPFVGP